MIPRSLFITLLFGCILTGSGLEPIPDKLVVLTFDDSVASQATFVAPLLKRLGFGATFFISEGFGFPTNKKAYMTWEHIAELNRMGFEIGNHTRDHMGVSPRTIAQLKDQVEAVNADCAKAGIPRPVSFAYPGNGITPEALPVLNELGFHFARRGGAPEHAYDWGRGFAYQPGRDHPLLLPSAGDARPDWQLSDFKRAADQAKDGKIAIIQFHGVPDLEHPWVNTPPERFQEYMRYLATNHFRVVALRDLEKFADAGQVPADPLAVVRERQAGRTEILVEGEVRDDAGRPCAARIYIQAADGTWRFPKSASSAGSAIRYERRNGRSEEMHTTLSAHPFRVELMPGTYTFEVEHGKEFWPERQQVQVQPGMQKLNFQLKRWINMAAQGWYSGDGHNHRNPAELSNVLLAEDLNAALPMVDWTTDAAVPPRRSGRGFAGDYGTTPVQADSTHVWGPRNTEYEIFRAGGTNHTLGALLILNHKTPFEMPAIPMRDVIRKARAEGALLDLEKHNWPWSIALAAIGQADLFELGNNHHWRSEYAIRNWAVPAPAWMGIQGTGTDTEQGWTLYGFQTYYALLNAGLRIKPSAGTANGVHPVPLGFSRVYVHVDGEFGFEKWMRGLAAGNSFVTTGPMLFANAEGKLPGTVFQESEIPRKWSCRIGSEEPLESIELIVNGEVFRRFLPENRKDDKGAAWSSATLDWTPETSGWAAWRCFTAPREGRLRFAHSAPFWFEVTGKPLHPRSQERDWLISRVREEIERSRGIAPKELIEEYESALRYYSDLTPR